MLTLLVKNDKGEIIPIVIGEQAKQTLSTTLGCDISMLVNREIAIRELSCEEMANIDTSDPFVVLESQC